MRRSLDDSFPHRLRRGEDHNKEVTTREVLLISGTIARFSGRRCLQPSVKNMVKKKPSRCIAVRRRCRPRFSHFFSLFQFHLPCFFPRSNRPRRSQATTRLIPPGSERRRLKSNVTELFRAITWQKQPCIIRYGARSRVLPDSERSMYWSAGGPVHNDRYDSKHQTLVASTMGREQRRI
ncbi:hypothetical protein GW17_00023890 [Ensete ventricosum]|nr:hypothetical protein GW17_00023890 [Ensete ventricosum]